MIRTHLHEFCVASGALQPLCNDKKNDLRYLRHCISLDCHATLAEALDELVMSVELEEVDVLDNSLQHLPILLSCEADGVPSLEGFPHVEEAYEMHISEEGVAIRAQRPHGLFNGVISLMQLLPPYAQMSDDIKLDCMKASTIMQPAAAATSPVAA